MPIPPPPPGFTLDTPTGGPAPTLGRPILRKGAEPKSGSLPQGWEVGPDGNARPIAGLPSEFTTPPPAKGNEPPSGYRFTKGGDLQAIPGGPADKKNEGDPLNQAIKGLGLEELLLSSGRARSQIKNGWATGILGGLSGAAPWPGTDRKDFLGTLQSLQGGIILEKLQALKDASKTGASGMGALSEKEGERLAAAVAAVNPDMSAEELNTSLDVIDRHAKTLQAIAAGENPDDPEVQKKYAIPPLPNVDGAAHPDSGAPPPPPAFTPSTDGTRSVVDPKKQALGNKIVGLMNKGADRNTIMGFAVRNDPTLRDDPKFRGWVDEALKIRKNNPKAQFNVDPSFYTSQVPLSEREQSRNMGAQTPLASAIAHVGDAATAGNLANIAGLVGGEEDQVRQGLAVQSQLNPKASLAGDVGGGALAAMTGEAALARLGMAPGVVRSLAADMAYGGTAGGSNSDADNFLGKLQDTGKGALLAGGGSLAGRGLLSGTGKAVRGVTNPTVSYVAREVPDALTAGQMLSQSGRAGAVVKGIEDRLSGVPVLGDAINARRLEGLQKMNSKAFDKALEPIKENIAGSYGEDAVAAAQEKVSSAFQKALTGKFAHLDGDFIDDATRAKSAIKDLPARVSAEVESSVDEAIGQYFDPASGALTGENLQPLLQELDGIKRAYRGDPLGHRIGKAIDLMSDTMEGMFRRQAPDVMPQYEAAKLAFKRLSTLEDAVLRAKNTGGVFTPAQLGLADRANTVKFGGKHKAAAGGGEFHDFQRAMQEVLPNKVPDSGTAGRLIVPAAIVGAGAGADYASGGTGTGLTLASLLTLAYSRKGQGLARLVTRPGGPRAQAVGKAIQKTARIGGSAVGTQAALGTTRD